MGGGKPKKPLSRADKRRKVAEPVKKKRKEEVRRSFYAIEEGLIKRAAKTVANMDIVTPSSLATSLNIKLSLARAVIRELINSGELKLISKRGALLIAIPARRKEN